MSLLSSLIYLFWFLSEILLHRILRGGKDTDKKKQDRGSLAYIWIIIIICTNISVYVTFNTSYPIYPGPLMNYTGLSLILLGMILRYWAIASLGRLFTVVVTIREGHHIKKDGLYGIIRHPSYAGSLLSFLGFGLSLNNWLSLLITFVPVFIAFAYRMQVEEKMLLSQFGEEYSAYMKRTSRIIPWIF
ncbi:methyltransferase family protein [Chitinophaga solisilvae]|uniref:Isoprenylcysteine carboxylmethyltransferase family protein n=1 Tax=Chitinophaga solisilvae TaxID=1233460 RepID=A0A433WAC1_9BACT|nr:isoprenylcysteine carboxylmethyltransferase family protein [Chitinophaga solisilvae]NSL86738.1 isoprenylcysteine carboxylmethyltransferase family protein [Chitinophaga solisilvae]